jgi:hypothetical protein
MTQQIVDGDRYSVVYVRATEANPLPVNIGSATLSVTADGVEIKNDVGNPIPTIQGLEIPAHDHIGNTWDANNNLLTVVYKRGGASGTTVATLTMTYDANDNLLTVDKS